MSKHHIYQLVFLTEAQYITSEVRAKVLYDIFLQTRS
jgi:hypothetical protein